MADRITQKMISMPPEWPAEKRAKFTAWLNDELTADEERDLLKLPKARRRSA